MKLPELTIHPLADRFPALPEKDFADLKESIRKHGLFDLIVVNKDNQILDGRHRYRALTELGVKIWANFNRYLLNFDEVKGSNEDLTEEQYIFESNIHRRHLTDDQRLMLAAEFAPFFRKEGEQKKAETQLIGKSADGKPVAKNGTSVDTKRCPPKKRDTKAKHANSTVGKVAAKAGVSNRKAAQALKVVTNPVLAAQVADGSKPLAEAVKEIEQNKPTKPKQTKLLDYAAVERAWKRAWNRFLDKYPERERLQVARIVFDILASERQ